MGLLDMAMGMMNSAATSGEGSTPDPKMALMQAALGMIGGHPDGPAGGLQELLGALKSSGLSDHVASWASGELNMPISADQIQQALSEGGPLQTLAEQAGLSNDQAAGHLAEMLPGLISQFSQHGSSEEGAASGIASMFGQFLTK
jgi:uncharacterized protein YidB (DUF937 family)